MNISKQTKNNLNQGSWIRQLFEKGNELKKKKKKIIDLSLGNPEIEPPKKVIESIKKNSEKKGIHQYMNNSGFEKTRQKIAIYLNKQKLIKTSKEKIVLTCGAAGAINVVLKTIINPKEEVIVFKPFFMEYKFYIENFKGKIIECKTKKNYSIDFNDLNKKISKKTKAIIINSPNNPTGKVYSKKELLELKKIILKQKNKIYVISDEPYRDIIFDSNKFTSISSIYLNSFMIYSWSKSLGLAGERIGFIACPKTMNQKIINGLILNNRILGFVNAPSLMQKIISENIKPIKNLNYFYQKKRDFISKELKKNGYEFFLPEGAFYLFIKSPIKNDIKFCLNAAKKNLLITPGTGFKQKGFFRIAFCKKEKTLKKAIKILNKLKQT